MVRFLASRIQATKQEPATQTATLNVFRVELFAFCTGNHAKSSPCLEGRKLFFGKEAFQAYVKHHPPEWFGRLIEAGGRNPDYRLEQMPSDLSNAGLSFV